MHSLRAATLLADITDRMLEDNYKFEELLQTRLSSFISADGNIIEQHSIDKLTEQNSTADKSNNINQRINLSYAPIAL